MSVFFDYTHNPLNQFESFSINHIIPLLLIIIGVAIIYILRHKLALSKYEITIRYTIAIIAILFEMAFQAWQMYHGKWNFADSLPLHLWRLTNYLGIIAMLTRNSKIFKVAYFWCLSGVVSILFPDILHGPDRFRYYHHMISHMLFFYM